MKLRKYVLGLLILVTTAAMAFASPAFATSAQDTQSPKQDMKDAGNATKDAAKDTGRATKKTATKTGKATKKATNKTAQKTKEGAQKVEDKTQPNPPQSE
jgi:Ni/Co efflux regulator RcnB